jgi:hypothetical protein
MKQPPSSRFQCFMLRMWGASRTVSVAAGPWHWRSRRSGRASGIVGPTDEVHRTRLIRETESRVRGRIADPIGESSVRRILARRRNSNLGADRSRHAKNPRVNCDSMRFP